MASQKNALDFTASIAGCVFGLLASFFSFAAILGLASLLTGLHAYRYAFWGDGNVTLAIIGVIFLGLLSIAIQRSYQSRAVAWATFLFGSALLLLLLLIFFVGALLITGVGLLSLTMAIRRSYKWTSANWAILFGSALLLPVLLGGYFFLFLRFSLLGVTMGLVLMGILMGVFNLRLTRQANWKTSFLLATKQSLWTGLVLGTSSSALASLFILRTL